MLNFIKLNIDKEIKSYFLGFLFSLILTIVPFLLVMNSIVSRETNYVVLLICSVTQIFIHFIYFLHLNCYSENKWNIITLLFVLIIIFIVVFGSIWIMYNLNHHMMVH